MRLFIAFCLPDEIKNELALIQNKLKKNDIEATWVKPENLHITVKFLSEVEEATVDAIKNTITETAEKFSSLKVKLSNLGFFPNEKRPRVFFVSTDKDKELTQIAESLEEYLETLGYPKEGRFKPHITLARIKSGKNIEGFVTSLIDIKTCGEFTIENLTLFKSELSYGGPKYQDIFRKDFLKN